MIKVQIVKKPKGWFWKLSTWDNLPHGPFFTKKAAFDNAKAILGGWPITEDIYDGQLHDSSEVIYG